MKRFVRPLSGLTVGLSISENEETPARGFPPWLVNRTTLQITSALFGQGAVILFGHDWRDDGVMEAVHALAMATQSVGDGEEKARPALLNLLAWPDQPHLSEIDRARLATTLGIAQAGLPNELSEYQNDALRDRSGRLYKYFRARALTHLRGRLNYLCRARVCIGGKRHRVEGRYPGIIEEALFAVRNRRALYLAGLFGGATQDVIAAIQGESKPEDFAVDDEMASLYHYPPAQFGLRPGKLRLDCERDPRTVWAAFQNFGMSNLCRANRLNKEENLELFETPVISRVIQLVLTGLSRLRKRPNRR